ncbi:MAG: alpha/beta hydrolase [Actinomycetes bacterium]
MNLRLRLVARAARRLPSVLDMSPAERAAARRGLPEPLARALSGATLRNVAVGDRVLDTAVGPVGTRLYLPVAIAKQLRPGTPTRFPLVVYAHGGGWVLGSLRGSDWLCSRVADRVGALVVSVDYRLAPEHPAPAAFDDYWAVLRHLLAHGEPALPVDTARVAVMGDSAGATLATLAAIRHKEALAAGEADLPAEPLAYQVLVYPGTDLTLASPTIDARADAPILPRSDLEAYLALYLGPSELKPDDPRVSPLFAPDLRHVAPALVLTTDLDPLEGEDVAYVERLREAGVAARHISYPDVPHGFISMAGMTPVAGQALDDVVSELRRALR